MTAIQSGRRVVLGTLTALGLSGLGCLRPSRTDESKIDPIGLAQKVESLYGSCKTYRDTCQVNNVIKNGRGEVQPTGQTGPSKVTTAFRRPDQFRFEFDFERGGKLKRYLFWRDGRSVKTWWDMEPGVKTPESLAFALSVATGVTESSSTTIPPLLMPDLLGRPNALSKGQGELTMPEDAAIGAHQCHRLRRRSEALNMRSYKKFEVINVYWIDAKSSAIRRVVNEMHDAELWSVGTIDLEPEFDVELPAPALAFDPPDAKP